MMYDDIANHPLNPRPGTLINHPDGDDVYAGVPKVPLTYFLSMISLCSSLLNLMLLLVKYLTL